MPNPGKILDGAQFVEEMKRLRVWAGNPSLAELNKRSGGFLLPPSTVSEVLRKPKLPRLGLLQAYVRACGLDDRQIEAWEQTWAVLTTREMQQQLPKSGDPKRLSSVALPQRHWARVDIHGILRWLSGVPATAPRTAVNPAEYARLGSTILLTSTMFALSTAWAAHVVLTPKWQAAVVAGMIVGVATISLDRLVVASIHRGHGRRHVLVIVPHALLSLLLALLIATPISLRIFAPEINAELAAAQYHSTQVTVLDKINAQYDQLINQLSSSQEELSTGERQVNCALAGGSDCQPAAQGQAYVSALKAQESAEANVTRAKTQIKNLRAEPISPPDDTTAAAPQQGLLANLGALNKITGASSTIAITRWLLLIFFTLLGCAPAIVKTVNVIGLKDTDENVIAQEIPQKRARTKEGH